MRWARVGVEKWVSLSSKSDALRGCGGLDDMDGLFVMRGWNAFNIWENRGPGRGCDPSMRMLV